MKVVRRQYEEYEHHGFKVTVRTDLKGTHRDYCLCYACLKFLPKDRKANCPIASALYEVCCRFGLTTPVFECPGFERRSTENGGKHGNDEEAYSVPPCL